MCIRDSGSDDHRLSGAAIDRKVRTLPSLSLYFICPEGKDAPLPAGLEEKGWQTFVLEEQEMCIRDRIRDGVEVHLCSDVKRVERLENGRTEVIWQNRNTGKESCLLYTSRCV